MISDVIQVSGKEYRIKGQIGEGAAADVFLARDIKNQNYAIKVIKNYNNPITKEMVDAEIAIQKSFASNKHVVQYIGFEKTEKLVYLVLELGECSLRRWIETNRELWQVELLNMIVDVSQALIDIHHKKVIHRDIKPENIIKVDNMYKITDFGVSCQSEEDESIAGTPLYWAPEMLLSDKMQKFTKKVDIWSFGVTIFQVYFKINPFCPASNKKMTYNEALAQLRKNIKLLTPNFTIEKVINELNKRGLSQQARFIQQKLKNTQPELLNVFTLIFQPDPEKRPNIDLIYALFESIKNSLEVPDIPKSKLGKKFTKWAQVPDDLLLFCRCKDLFYELDTYCKSKMADKVIFALEIAIWYLEGANYGGTKYLDLEKMDIIKDYRKPAHELWSQVKITLCQYYLYLKCEAEVKTYDKINDLRMRILTCSVWWALIKQDSYFCKMVTKIAGLEINHPLQMFDYLHMYSEKSILQIEEVIINKYY